MATLSPAQLNHQPAGVMSAPENTHHSSPIVTAGQKAHCSYKSLLNQHAQKLKKQPPVYETQNEGADHQPRFRSTVWVDGVSYTSSNTFPLRKTSEMDASRVAYIAITQKEKTDAFRFIQQEKIYCKSIVVEFAAKKNFRKPVYETATLEASSPTFRSYMHFNGVTYTGDYGKNKKEAEQLVARSVIFQYLDSEFGVDMAHVVNCKLRQYQEVNAIQSGSNVIGPQVGVGHSLALSESGTNTMATMAISSAVPESGLVHGTMVPATSPSSGPQLSVETITPTAPFVTQPPVQQVSTELVNPTVTPVTQPPTAHVKSEPVHSVFPFVTQQPSPQVSVESIKPVVAESVVMTPVTSAVVNDVSTPVVTVEIPETNSIIPQIKPEASAAQSLEYIPLVDQDSNKKRSRASKKNARKKMRANAQRPVIPATSQDVPISSPMNSSDAA